MLKASWRWALFICVTTEACVNLFECKYQLAFHFSFICLPWKCRLKVNLQFAVRKSDIESSRTLPRRNHCLMPPPLFKDHLYSEMGGFSSDWMSLECLPCQKSKNVRAFVCCGFSGKQRRPYLPALSWTLVKRNTSTQLTLLPTTNAAADSRRPADPAAASRGQRDFPHRVKHNWIQFLMHLTSQLQL